ncbi:hypothetical protein [Streptomyces arenae]|uniref:hypothetical protein n=1 Tax=Streptomyces arenae TaxID=29301 RepID=UPI00265A3B9E|nr:hypothetical protein [Streptomyces arenae]MCG7207381.1 hypothetical protein [Streptomyces arenae]
MDTAACRPDGWVIDESQYFSRGDRSQGANPLQSYTDSRWKVDAKAAGSDTPRKDHVQVQGWTDPVPRRH